MTRREDGTAIMTLRGEEKVIVVEGKVMIQGSIITESNKGWWIVEQYITHTALFIHHSSIPDQRCLHVGDRVQFEVAPNPRRPGKFHAINVKYVGHTNARQTGDVRP